MSDESSQIVDFWQNTLGVKPGDEVMILPVGGAPGQGFQGILVNLAISGATLCPMAVIIQQAVGLPHVTIPWHAVQMITQPQVSRADAEAAAEAAQKLVDLDPKDVLSFFEENGIEAPEELRQAAIGD